MVQPVVAVGDVVKHLCHLFFFCPLLGGSVRGNFCAQIGKKLNRWCENLSCIAKISVRRRALFQLLAFDELKERTLGVLMPKDPVVPGLIDQAKLAVWEVLAYTLAPRHR